MLSKLVGYTVEVKQLLQFGYFIRLGININIWFQVVNKQFLCRWMTGNPNTGGSGS